MMRQKSRRAVSPPDNASVGSIADSSAGGHSACESDGFGMGTARSSHRGIGESDAPGLPPKSGVVCGTGFLRRPHFGSAECPARCACLHRYSLRLVADAARRNPAYPRDDRADTGASAALVERSAGFQPEGETSGRPRCQPPHACVGFRAICVEAVDADVVTAPSRSVDCHDPLCGTADQW